MTSGGGGGGAGGALTGVVDSGVSNASSESELLVGREKGRDSRLGGARSQGLTLLSGVRPPGLPGEAGPLPN